MKRALLSLLLLPPLQAQFHAVNPTVQTIVDSVSADHMAETLKKLESFGTRNIFSSQDDPEHGVGAARQWIAGQFRSYSPRLQVSFDSYKVKKVWRMPRDVEIHNIVAVLPGKVNPAQRVIVSAHYDSLVSLQATGADVSPDAEPPTPDEQAGERPAPGVTDDGSGTAAVLELARVMSQYEFDNTIVFVAFAGEEYGLVGSSLFARKAREEKQSIIADLNNDIIGSDLAGNGRRVNSRVSVFSEDPNDSPSRQVARYVQSMAQRYVPSMTVDMVFREDRFARGGDHTPFNREGYAAVRLTSPAENYSNQHTDTDTFANTSVAYAAAVAKVNAAALASLGLAPKTPIVVEEITKGINKGKFNPTLGRGKSRYDAVLRWKSVEPEPDLLGYAVVQRSTTSPVWEWETFVGTVHEFTLKDISIDNMILGVKAVDRDGNESLVAAYIARPYAVLKFETY